MKSVLVIGAGQFGTLIAMRMEELRCEIDAMEPLIPRGIWPYPTYGDMLFYGN